MTLNQASLTQGQLDPRGLALPILPGDALTTDDIDEVTEELTKVVSPHRTEPSRKTRRIAAVKAQCSIGDVLLFQTGYGAEVMITAESCAPYVLFKMPLSGRARIRCGSRVVDTTPDLGAVLNRDDALQFDYSEDCTQLVLRVDGRKLERHCAQLLSERGGGLDKPLDFDLGFSLAGDGGQHWLRLLKYLRDEAVRGAASLLCSSPLALAPFEQLLMTTLLTVQPHNYSGALSGPACAAAPRYVKRAEDYMRAYIDDPLTLDEIAAEAGVSARALLRGFQEFRGASPMAHLKALRLQRVREELLAGEPGKVSVTDTALRWGFAHLGHFGQDYKRRFGETPAETLRRRCH